MGIISSETHRYRRDKLVQPRTRFYPQITQIHAD